MHRHSKSLQVTTNLEFEQMDISNRHCNLNFAYSVLIWTGHVNFANITNLS